MTSRSSRPPTRWRWQPVAWAAAAALLVATLGGLATDIGPWYRSLQQPDWKPPDAWFGPVWTTIYALTALAAVHAWRQAPDRAARERLLVACMLNAFLNVLWSLLFFRLQRPDWALAEVVLLWLSIVAMMWVLGRHSRLAVVLLLPYLAWVAFAAALNLAVVQLNAPFGR